MSNIHGECGVEYLHSENIKSIKICDFQHIKSSFKTFLCRPPNSNEQAFNDDFIHHISESLYQDTNLPSDNGIKPKNPDLAREFVQMTINNRINRPICIDDLKNLLFTSKTVLFFPALVVTVFLLMVTRLSLQTYLRFNYSLRILHREQFLSSVSRWLLQPSP